MPNRLLIFALFILLFAGCRKFVPERAFYYWKTTFKLSEREEKYLTDLDIHKLYLRLFDVDWDEARNTALPVGKLNFVAKPRIKLSYVPVVYIVNKTLQKTSQDGIDELAAKILGQVQSIMTPNKLSYNELQIDCDWTETTRIKYFYLLDLLKLELEKNNQTLSATIRLHQIKYASVTGVPPVHRGMLMYYNMGKLDVQTNRNSIFNLEDASKYVGYISKYPLPLDVVLPAFSWGVHFRGEKVIDLLNNLSSSDFKNSANFRRVDSLHITVDSSMFFKGFYFMKADQIKIEEVPPGLCLQAAQQLTDKLQHKPGAVAIFHLDSLTITRYEEKSLEEILNSFH